MVFWMAIALFFGALIGGYCFFLYVCGRKKVPDYWDKRVLERWNRPALRDGILAGKAWMASKYTHDIWITSDDDLRLHATLLTQRKARGTILLFHGYHSSWKADFSSALPFLYEQGFQLLLVDQRAHGRSQGRYITYGVCERFDVRAWLSWAEERFSPAHPLYLYGVSMGAATVLMSAGLELPGDVRGIIADCGFTSPYDIIGKVFTDKTDLPPGPALALLNLYTGMFAGFGLKDASAAEAVRETALPVLLIHGKADTFVPCRMSQEIFENCAGEKQLLLVEGAEHAMSYVTDRTGVESAMNAFLNRNLPHTPSDGGRKAAPSFDPMEKEDFL